MKIKIPRRLWVSIVSVLLASWGIAVTDLLDPSMPRDPETALVE